jgi:ABC-type Co2+ transport system permease subunit
MEKILTKSTRLKHCISYWADVVVPGCGMIFYKRAKNSWGLGVLTVTAVFYGAALSSDCFAFNVPIGMSHTHIAVFCALFPVYNAAFLVRAIIKTVREFNAKEAVYGA